MRTELPITQLFSWCTLLRHCKFLRSVFRLTECDPEWSVFEWHYKIKTNEPFLLRELILWNYLEWGKELALGERNIVEIPNGEEERDNEYLFWFTGISVTLETVKLKLEPNIFSFIL